MMVIVSYGGGTNSTAMLVGLYERAHRPDAITFADTGDEKPHTYEHIDIMQEWCRRVGFPQITIVCGSSPQQLLDGSLSNECLRLGTMPAKAYGRGACSEKWKLRPQARFDDDYALRHNIDVTSIVRLIGFDADEPERADRAMRLQQNGRPQQQFPLIEWGWGREECVAAIARAGLPQPGKSACYFCPSSKKKEILWLASTHPELMARALEIERRATAGEGPSPISMNGLGRNYKWADLLAFNEKQQQLFDYGTPEIDCGCYDG